jgi:4-hydroxy-3-polyprenylbenzoate decarboxylase
MAVETTPRAATPRDGEDASRLKDPKGPPAPKEALRSLPATMDWLRGEGLLMETDVEVDGDLQLTGIQKHFDGSYPILFNNVKKYPGLRAVTNLFANMDIVDRMFGWPDRTERTRKLSHAITHPVPNEEIPQDQAPCQEVVITDDLDVNKHVMAIRHTHLESEITIGSGNSVVVGKHFWGGTHIGYNRMNFRWGNIGTFQISPGSHMWQVLTKYYGDEPIPLTVCFGLPVASTLLAGGGFDYVVLPRGGDELGAAGAVQGFPTRIVKARTVDAYAVADSEIVRRVNIDELRSTMQLPALSPGDRLVFKNVGAYNVTQWMQFITLRPAVVMIGASGKVAVIRRAEELADFTEVERVPEWLK